MSQSVERWGICEFAFPGPSAGNPFVEVQLDAEFTHKNRSVHVDGFYDGDGTYRIRFAPDTVGAWHYVTRSNAAALDCKRGELTCVEPSLGNHGPVGVRDTYHFAYADGTPLVSVGTTCYVWNHQGDALEAQTLETLKHAPFNKMRMCVFPKDYLFNKNEPEFYPFERDAAGGWDWTRFNPAYFQHLERRVGDLLALGIEADIILFHPYDRWGFATMSAETDDRTLCYVIARLAAYRNVWWSLANEYDLMQAKTMVDWDRFFRIVQESDPYQHLRSVHNCHSFYDHGKPWVTHCSVQHHDLKRVREWRELYRKPVVVDECGYEGNIERSWGSLPAQELVHRFWLGVCNGGYVGHGETYLHPQDILWWAKGGVLHGESPARIAFLRRILEEGPAEGLEPAKTPSNLYGVGRGDDYRLIYLAVQQPAEFILDLPAEGEYRSELIDTWGMTITPLEGRWRGQSRLKLPGRPYLALRVCKVA
jgi:hypothetical protein